MLTSISVISVVRISVSVIGMVRIMISMVRISVNIDEVRV